MPTIDGEEFTFGSRVKLRLEVVVDGQLTDPTGEVTLIWEVDDAGGATEIYNGGAGNVVRESQGVFTFELDLDTAGTYEYRWKTVGPKGAIESWFVVPVSRVTSP